MMPRTDMTSNVQVLVNNLLSKLTKQCRKPHPTLSTIRLFSAIYDGQSQDDFHFPCTSQFAAPQWLFFQFFTVAAILSFGSGGYRSARRALHLYTKNQTAVVARIDNTSRCCYRKQHEDRPAVGRAPRHRRGPLRRAGGMAGAAAGARFEAPVQISTGVRGRTALRRFHGRRDELENLR